MSNYDELVERLEDKLPELDRRARLADISVNNAADALDAAAGRDAQAEVATIRQAAAAIRALEGEIERLRGLLPEGFVAVPREAIQPFSDLGLTIDAAGFGAAIFRDEDTAFEATWTENGKEHRLTWGDFRAIRRAMIQAQTDGAKALQDGRDG